MPAVRKYLPELNECAVCVVLEARGADGGSRGACTRIGQQLGILSDMLRGGARPPIKPLIEYIDWYNRRHLNGEIGHIPPSP